MLRINYLTLAQYNLNEMRKAGMPGPVFTVLAAPWFVLRMIYSVIASQWAWYHTNRSDLALRIAAPDASITGIERVRWMAQGRVERGLVGYEAWVEYCDVALMEHKIRGNRTGLGAG